MSITIGKSTMVIPSKETPRHPIWLSGVDLTKRTPYSHTPIVYVYRNNSNSNSNSNRISSKYFDSSILISSLSEILVPFYPLAGRLWKNDETGRIEIDCNAKGVFFVEAETTYELTDLGEFNPDDMLKNLLIPSCDYSGGLENIPLAMVQLTRFRCGGVCMGLAAHHFAGDGSAFVYWASQWARLARGVGLAVSPVFDRTCVFVARDPPQVKFNHLEFERQSSNSDQLSRDPERTEDKIVKLFKFSKEQIDALKKQAMPKTQEMKHSYSTFDVMAAHVWRSALKARGVQYDKLVKFSSPINGRSKFKQGVVPQGYVGNLIFNSVYHGKAGEIVSRPLWYAASKVHETVTKVDEEYIRSAIDFLSLQSDPTVFATGPHSSRCPDIHVNYWKGIPLYAMDFGWGKPVFVRHGGIGFEGQVFIMPSEDGDCLFVAISLFSSHMDRFEKIIYDFDDRRANL